MIRNVDHAPARPPGVRPPDVHRVAVLLALLAVTSACSSTQSASQQPTGSVSGTVLSVPACPGPERSGHPCPPRAVKNATVAALVGSKTVVSTHTTADGRFRLSLPAGTYLIRATNVGGYPSTAAQTVVLSAARPVRITLTVDSGMR